MNWVKHHKVLTAILVIVALAVIGGVSGNKPSSSTTNSDKTTKADKTYRFTDRADKQKTDIEITSGEPATIDGVKLTVTGIVKKSALSDYQTAASGKTYIVAT